MEDSIRKADILIEAIPYIQKFRGKVIVAKYGGSAIDNPAAMRGILQDLVFLTEVGIRSFLFMAEVLKLIGVFRTQAARRIS